MNSSLEPEILRGFVREVESYLPKLAESLSVYRANPGQVEVLEEAYRMMHCIRGAGATVGLLALSRLAQYPEDTLEQILSGELHWSEDLSAALDDALLRISGYLDGMQSEAFDERGLVTGLVCAFRRLRQLPEAGDEAEINELLGPGEEQPAPPLDDSLETLISEENYASEEVEEPGEAPLEEPAFDEGPSEVMQVFDEVSADDDLWAAFQEESSEHFTNVVEVFAKLEHQDDPGALKVLRRSVHQLKGACGVLGMRRTSFLNAQMQKVLDRVFEGEAAWSGDLLPVFQAAFDVVLESVGGRGTGANLIDRAAALEKQFTEILAGTTPAPAARPALSVPDPRPTPLSAPVEAMQVDRVEAGEDLWDAFHHEAEEHLHHIGDLLRSCERNTPEPATIQELRRSVHTLKGACGVVGMRQTSALAHRMEDLLDALYDGAIVFARQHPPVLFATYDVLVDSLANRGISTGHQAEVVRLFGEYAALLKAKQAIPDTRTAEETLTVREVPRLGAEPAVTIDHDRKQAQFVRAPLERVDELVRLVSELVIHRSRFEQYLSAYVHEIGELQLSTERLNRISRRLQSDYEASALQEANRRMSFALVGGGRGLSGTGGEDWDALEFDRYTEFHLLSRDLAETTGDVTNSGSRLNDLISDFDSYLNRLNTLTGDVEDRLTRLRMLPLRNLSQRLHRTVRVTAERRNKTVDLFVEGENVELDKTVLEEMAGPIDHLLRNSVDHGIETAERRTAAGKSVRGSITLRAYHEGTQVVLQLSDDGRGLDTTRVRETAIRNGMVSPEDASTLSDQELYSLIFLPGFSTAREVSEVSGRGVGLDVVKATVSKLKGTISVTSDLGKGTTFTIRLPMTLALTRVVLVKSVNETYAIPLAAVSQILRIEPEQLERVGRKPVLRLAGKIVPTMHLAEVVGQQLPPDANLTRLKAVVLHIGEQRLALMVDNVVEAREVVVKNLGTMLGRVHAVTGATIMGDGNVVLILDPNDMLHQQHAVTPQVRLRAASPVRKPAGKDLNVLIVDDSPSVRRVISTLVTNAGWKSQMAKDGLDALEMLHSTSLRPDVVLLDIEMPRMDGYELTAALRNLPQFRSVPIVILTSRAGDKHRKRAFELGATDYLIKPYQDDELLATIRRVVAASTAGDRL
ncbi:MAG: Hpt domain-containing protein [Bryobacterales bacterium]|nr:Hpt domain-containing protein [Bryobacterales bacterium]